MGLAAEAKEPDVEKYIQFSFFLVNKPGVLTRIFRDLAKAKVNVKALAMMDSMEHGVLRMVVDNPAGARRVLAGLSIPVNEAEVLAITLPNRPGAAADLCERLSESHINIGYMYCTGGAAGGKSVVVLKVPDIAKAMKVLDSNHRAPRRDMKIKLRRPAGSNHRR